MDDGLKPPDKGIVYIVTPVGGQYHQPVVALDALQQIGHFLVGVLIMGIADICSFAEERVGFVKKQYPVFVFGFIEESRQVFLCFTDVLGHHPREIDAEDVFAGVFAQ